MAGKKPLIFVSPLSETLTKLLEVTKESADADGVELYEVSETNEMAQLLPTLGASLTIMSQPKKCAMILKANRKTIKQQQSKVILLSGKRIPPKTLDKFMKVGLTECIVEPIAPKSLMYKVKLFLRSLPSNEKEKEFEKKFGSGEKEEEGEEAGIKSLKGKKNGDNENDNIDTNLKGKISKEEQEEEIIEREKRKSNYQEEDLGGHYKGKTNKDNQPIEEEADQANETGVDQIDTHYKNDSDYKEEEQDENMISKRDGDADIIESDNEASMLEKGLDLDIEDNDPVTDNKQESDEDDGPSLGLKEKLELNLEDDGEQNYIDKDDTENEETDTEKDSFNLDIEDDEKSSNDIEQENDNKIDKYYKNKTSNGADLDLEDENEITQENENDNEEEDKQKREDSLDLDLEDEESSDREIQEAQDLADGKITSEDGKVDQIDKYYRNKGAKQDQDEEEDKAPSLAIEAVERPTIEADSDFTMSSNDDNKNEDSPEQKEKFDLDIKDEKESKQDNQEEEEESTKRPSAEHHDLDIIDDESKNNNSDDGEHEDFKAYKKKKTPELEVDDDLYAKSEKDEEDENGHKRKRSDIPIEQEQKYRSHSSNVDHIDTYYGRKKKERENKVDDNWDVDRDDTIESNAEEKEHEDRELIIEHEDLGEQTINYRQLKKQFEESDWSPRKKKNWKITDGEKKEDLGIGFVGREIIQGEELPDDPDILKEIEEEDEDKETIFEPDPKGLHHLIEILSLYENPDIKNEDIFKFISEKIYQEEQGRTVFFYKDPNTKNDLEIFNGVTENTPNPLSVEEWEEFCEDNMEDLYKVVLPTWSDKTFQSDNIYFYYPLFEGIEKMGHAIVIFNKVFAEKNCSKIEVLLESSRGIYIEKNHKDGNKGKYKAKGTAKKDKKKGGLFAGLFGRKSA